MGFFKDMKAMFELSSIDGSKKYRERSLTGRDIVTGKSNYTVNNAERI